MTGKERYAEYLLTPHWAAVKERKAKIEQKRCMACHSTAAVELHHMIYRDILEDVQDDDTCWLCRKHHEAFHAVSGMQLRGVPYHLLRPETVRVILSSKKKTVILDEVKRQALISRVARKAEKKRIDREVREEMRLEARRKEIERRIKITPAIVPRRNLQYDWPKVSYAEQARHKTKKGGYSRAQLEAWGVLWPAKKGWPNKLHQGKNPNI